MTKEIESLCPFCDQKYRLDEDAVGGTLACQNPACGREFTVEASNLESQPAAGSLTATKLKPVARDDFETVHPDELIVHISRSPILKTLAISLGLHIALIAILSIGNFVMCVKYKTFSVTGAVADHAEALKEEEASEKKAARAKAQAARKAKRDAAQAKSDAGKEPKRAGDAAEKPAKEKSAIEKELAETSSERPTESSMSLDDVDDGL